MATKQRKVDNASEAPASSPSDTPKTKSAKIPQTMEELLAKTGYALKGFKKGDVVEGTVAFVSPKEVRIDIGSKSEGVVIDRELENFREVLQALKPGEKVVCQVIVAENDRGQSVLSLRRSIFEQKWKELADHIKSGEPVDVMAREAVRGGILVDYAGIRGYIPQSQLDSASAKQVDKLSGRRLQAKVIEADRETNRLVFSQRAITDAGALAKQRELLEGLETGSAVGATITSTVPFGAFAKFMITHGEEPQEVEGLIHISEIAWEKVDDAGQYLKTGDKIKVKVIGVDGKTGKLSLSLKQMLPDPWENALDMFEKDSQVKGIVSRVTPYGIFITLSPGIEGLLHISKVSPGEEPKAGDEITCIIEDVQADKRKISLSMALTEKPIGYR